MRSWSSAPQPQQRHWRIGRGGRQTGDNGSDDSDICHGHEHDHEEDPDHDHDDEYLHDHNQDHDR